MLESKSAVVLVAGIIFFALAFVSNALVPVMMYQHLPEKKVEELINPHLRYQFEDLAQRYPEQFKKVYGEPPEGEQEASDWYDAKCAEALRVGHKVYVGEGCWHCHSQFVRPVSNESKRWGPVSTSEEYQNELQRPVLFGTRRVGPDLSREAGRRSSDWHAVHFFRPQDLSEGSPMPRYPWLFDGSADKPNERGLGLITYVQWLGTWLDSYPYYEDYIESPIAELEKELAQSEPETESEGSEGEQ